MSNNAYATVLKLVKTLEEETRPLLDLLQALKSTGSIRPDMSLRMKDVLNQRMANYTAYRPIFEAHKLQAGESGVMVEETNNLIERFDALVADVEAVIQQL